VLVRALPRASAKPMSKEPVQRSSKPGCCKRSQGVLLGGVANGVDLSEGYDFVAVVVATCQFVFGGVYLTQDGFAAE